MCSPLLNELSGQIADGLLRRHARNEASRPALNQAIPKSKEVVVPAQDRERALAVMSLDCVHHVFAEGILYCRVGNLDFHVRRFRVNLRRRGIPCFEVQGLALFLAVCGWLVLFHLKIIYKR